MSKKVDVTIIIPSRKNDSNLKKTLKAIEGMNTSGLNFKVEVVFDLKGRGSYLARNKGIEKTKSKYIAFIDAGSIPDKSWLTNGVKHLLKYDYVVGPVSVTNNSKSMLSKLLSIYSRSREFPVEEFFTDYHFGPTTNLFVKRQVFDSFGNFDGSLLSSGDYEFGQRCFNSKVKQFYASDVIVYHEVRSFYQYINKNKRLAYGFVQLNNRYPSRYKTNPLIQFVKIFLPPIWLFWKSNWKSSSVKNKVVIFLFTYLFSIIQNYWTFIYLVGNRFGLNIKLNQE